MRQWNTRLVVVLKQTLVAGEISAEFDCLVGLVVKTSTSRAEDPWFEMRLRRDFFGVESYQWQASGVIGSGLGLVGPVSVYCDWVRWKFGMQLLLQCGSTYNCLCRSVSEIHSHVAGALSNQPTNKLLNLLRCVFHRGLKGEVLAREV